MNTAITAKVFKMPFNSINFPLSEKSSAVFFDRQKLHCANEVSASKQASKLEVKNNIRQIGIPPIANASYFLIFKAWIFCALKNCINPILQPRCPITDYRGYFL